MEWAIELYGETKRHSQAGYMLEDGRLLDLLRTQLNRILHASVARSLLPDSLAPSDDQLVCELMQHTGWVRLDLNKGYVHLVTRPTDSQLQKLFGLLKYRAEPLSLYVTDELGHIKLERRCFPLPINELRVLIDKALAAPAESGVLAVSH